MKHIFMEKRLARMGDPRNPSAVNKMSDAGFGVMSDRTRFPDIIAFMKPWGILPAKFLEKLDTFLPNDKRQNVLESFSERKPSTLRTNTLKITSNQLQDKLKSMGIETEKVPWYKDAFILKNVPQKVLAETEPYKNGFLYVQSLSSMIPPLVLDPQPNDLVLDLTAAPGSKTTQMAMMMHNSGILIANDKSYVRSLKLKANLAIQGVINTQVLSLPGEFIWKKYPEYFDKTLIDTPCSMEGRFILSDEKSYRDWTPGKVKMLSKQQKWLLRSGVSATRVGGIVVYSTCTLSPEENEEVIDWILKKEVGALVVEEIAISSLPTNTGLTKYKNKIFSQELKLKKTVRIYPSPLMEGFFIAKLKKIRSTVSSR